MSSSTTCWEVGRRGLLVGSGCGSDFDLRTDNQAITWLKTNKNLNKMYVRWLDEIEDFRFDVTHLPGARNPSDPLSRRGFADGSGPAASTGDPDPESQQELFSRLGRDAPASAVLLVIRAGWDATLQSAAATFTDVQKGERNPPHSGGEATLPPCAHMFVALAGSQLDLRTGTTVAATQHVPADDHFLAPTVVRTLVQALAVDVFFLDRSCAGRRQRLASR